MLIVLVYFNIYFLINQDLELPEKNSERNREREQKESRKERGWGRKERKGAREQGRKSEYRNSL